LFEQSKNLGESSNISNPMDSKHIGFMHTFQESLKDLESTFKNKYNFDNGASEDPTVNNLSYLEKLIYKHQ
jgi:hypothetical protein